MEQNQPDRTLIMKSEIYNVKPNLIQTQRTDSLMLANIDWRPTVSLLKKSKQIVFNLIDKLGEKILFTFWESTAPYKYTCHATVKRRHFECSMIANDRRDEANQDENSHVVLVYVKNANLNPCNLIKFSRDDAQAGWFPEIERKI